MQASAQVRRAKETLLKTVQPQDTSSIEIIDTFDQSAEFPGGTSRFPAYINRNLKYTGEAKGQILIQFTVEKEGSLSNVKILHGLTAEVDSAVAVVVRKSPKWKPGIQNNRPVIQQLTLSVQVGKSEK